MDEPIPTEAILSLMLLGDVDESVVDDPRIIDAVRAEVEASPRLESARRGVRAVRGTFSPLLQAYSAAVRKHALRRCANLSEQERAAYVEGKLARVGAYL